jgi:hypothetical protein
MSASQSRAAMGRDQDVSISLTSGAGSYNFRIASAIAEVSLNRTDDSRT